MSHIILILVFGALFGWIIDYGCLNKYDVISAQAGFQNNTVIKAILLSIGVGAILLSIFIGLGWAGFHVKPFVVWGVVLGGLIFGAGMAVLGYCPGTLPISAAQGAVDAWLGIAGGVLGGWFYTLIYPYLNGLLGINWGKISLFSLIESFSWLYYILVLILGGFIIFIAFKIPLNKAITDKRWAIAGILLAILNSIVFLKITTNRPIGASTTYPYLGAHLGGLTNSVYYQKVQTPGHWELLFLTGAFLLVLIRSLLQGNFKWQLIYPRWADQFGTAKSKRIWVALIGGFVLIFGARLAGGCTSGHILSGGMQLAVSSLVFAVFVFLGLYLTGKFLQKTTRGNQ